VPYDPPLVKRLRFFSSSTHFLGPCRRALAGFGRLFGGAPRKRILTEEELKGVWIVAPDNAFGSYSEVVDPHRPAHGRNLEAHGRHDWEDTITLPSWLTKNGRQHSFPIGSVFGLRCRKLSAQPVKPFSFQH